MVLRAPRLSNLANRFFIYFMDVGYKRGKPSSSPRQSVLGSLPRTFPPESILYTLITNPDHDQTFYWLEGEFKYAGKTRTAEALRWSGNIL